MDWDWEAMALLRGGEVGLWPCHKIPTFSSWTGWAQAQEVGGGTLVGAQSTLSSEKQPERGEGMGPAVAGSGGARLALTWWWKPGWCPRA